MGSLKLNTLISAIETSINPPVAESPLPRLVLNVSPASDTEAALYVTEDISKNAKNISSVCIFAHVHPPLGTSNNIQLSHTPILDETRK